MSKVILGWREGMTSSSRRKKFKADSVERKKDLDRAIGYNYDGHLVTFAPTGSGKGVGVIIPNLLHFDGPIITIDPKGENFAVTAKFRKDVLGQKIHLLDPFEFVSNELLDEVGVERGGLNPLSYIVDYGTDIETQLTMLASVISTYKSGGSSHDFWDNEAQKLMVGALGAAIGSVDLSKESPKFSKFIDYLYRDDVVYSLAVVLDTIGKKIPPISYKSINAYLQKADKERSGVLSTASSYLNPLIAKSITKYLDFTSITLEELTGEDRYTIYIVIPPSKLISHSVLLRMWISILLVSVMEREEKPEKSTLFLLDECAQLGSLEGLSKAITLLRGYGLQVWMFFQDVSQIKNLYQDNYMTLINNCGVFQAFGIHRMSNASSILDIIGEQSFTAEEMISMDRSRQILSIADRKPEMVKMLNYLEDEAFNDRYIVNPFFRNHSSKRRASGFNTPMNPLGF